MTNTLLDTGQAIDIVELGVQPELVLEVYAQYQAFAHDDVVTACIEGVVSGVAMSIIERAGAMNDDPRSTDVAGIAQAYFDTTAFTIFDSLETEGRAAVLDWLVDNNIIPAGIVGSAQDEPSEHWVRAWTRDLPEKVGNVLRQRLEYDPSA